MLTLNTTFKEFSILKLLQDLTELSWNYNYLFSKHFAQSISRDHSQKQYCNEDWKLTKDKDKDSSEISNFFNDLQRQEFLQRIKDFRNLWILKMDQSQSQRFINFKNLKVPLKTVISSESKISAQLENHVSQRAGFLPCFHHSLSIDMIQPEI